MKSITVKLTPIDKPDDWITGHGETFSVAAIALLTAYVKCFDDEVPTDVFTALRDLRGTHVGAEQRIVVGTHLVTVEIDEI